ncbi:unnamed protein product [Durusdinium trenchii]|uniref:Uncharacterized protein n=2 Tax=Durusdinium trenchii TaxID=1381693 RepID=A0ABP0J2H9_9DINO
MSRLKTRRLADKTVVKQTSKVLKLEDQEAGPTREEVERVIQEGLETQSMETLNCAKAHVKEAETIVNELREQAVETKGKWTEELSHHFLPEVAKNESTGVKDSFNIRCGKDLRSSVDCAFWNFTPKGDHDSCRVCEGARCVRQFGHCAQSP